MQSGPAAGRQPEVGRAGGDTARWRDQGDTRVLHLVLFVEHGFAVSEDAVFVTKCLPRLHHAGVLAVGPLEVDVSTYIAHEELCGLDGLIKQERLAGVGARKEPRKVRDMLQSVAPYMDSMHVQSAVEHATLANALPHALCGLANAIVYVQAKVDLVAEQPVPVLRSDDVAYVVLTHNRNLKRLLKPLRVACTTPSSATVAALAQAPVGTKGAYRRACDLVRGILAQAGVLPLAAAAGGAGLVQAVPGGGVAADMASGSGRNTDAPLPPLVPSRKSFAAMAVLELATVQFGAMLEHFEFMDGWLWHVEVLVNHRHIFRSSHACRITAYEDAALAALSSMGLTAAYRRGDPLPPSVPSFLASVLPLPSLQEERACLAANPLRWLQAINTVPRLVEGDRWLVVMAAVIRTRTYHEVGVGRSKQGARRAAAQKILALAPPAAS